MNKLRIFSVVAIVIFCFTGIAFSDSWSKETRKGMRNNSKQYQKSHRNEKQQYDHRSSRDGNRRDTYRRDDRRSDRRDDHDRGREYRNHRGYSAHPYQKHRRYGHHVHKGHRYAYQGHWRSWDQWHRYAKGRPGIYRHGHYYREGGHLMFRFLDPVSGGYLFFSIGR